MARHTAMPSIKRRLAKLPITPGVYFFKDARGRVIYVGKASRLRHRVRSYFHASNALHYHPTKSALRDSVRHISWVETQSEVEAFIRESQEIKRLRPEFNLALRDDKQYFYVAFTREKWPKVVITHQPISRTLAIGPFTSGRMLKNTLRLLRRVIPYCTCKQRHKQPCLNAKLGLCPGICCVEVRVNAISRHEYLHKIMLLKFILRGRVRMLLRTLKREMAAAAARQDFESARTTRDLRLGLKNILEHRDMLDDRSVSNPVEEVPSYGLIRIESGIRTEGYDLAHLGGAWRVAGMVVFDGVRPQPREYRLFKIRAKSARDDLAMLEETLNRRLRHFDWPLPHILFIDGGQTQILTAARVCMSHNFKPALFSLAKPNNIIYTVVGSSAVKAAVNSVLAKFLKYVDREAHRFAHKYHVKVRAKDLVLS